MRVSVCNDSARRFTHRAREFPHGTIDENQTLKVWFALWAYGLNRRKSVKSVKCFITNVITSVKPAVQKRVVSAYRTQQSCSYDYSR